MANDRTILITGVTGKQQTGRRDCAGSAGNRVPSARPDALYDKMLGLYPNRVNPGWALWSSARAVKS